MTKLMLISCLLAQPHAHADYQTTLHAAEWSFHLYTATQRFVGCLWWHNSKFHSMKGVPPNDVVRLAEDTLTYPFVLLLAPPYLDGLVSLAAIEVQAQARAGDLDISHSKTLTQIEYTASENIPPACAKASGKFLRTLKKYLEIEKLIR